MAPPNERRILLAFDFGTRRIGVATANLETRTASPLTTLRVERDLPWTELDRILADWRPAQLVVGVPEGEGAATVARRARQFAAALGNRYALPVATVDETLTSVEAETTLAENRRSGYLRRRVGRGRVDRVAACLIAEQWINEHPQT
ncbi:MAG TPA: Holliday junction resolvase RuvX [Gammaproteobacteria bacterium]|nr:Holliday junction resolvase RuvX [Gammaproteobacteria bacterium]